VAIEDLFGHEPNALSLVRDYCNVDLKHHNLELADKPLTLTRYAENLGWEPFSQFKVNERGMILNFSAAAGLPHVLGLFEIYLPWEFVRALLPPSIRTFLESCGLPVN